MKKLVTIFLISIFASTAQAKVIGKTVEYKINDTIMKGYIAYDDRFTGKRPGILLVHEWWGHNDYTRRRARILAKLGYVAFSLDMYGKGKIANHPKDAGKFKAEVDKNRQLKKARFMAAYDLLKQNPYTDTSKLAALGYCFGGGVVLDMMREGIDLDAVVSFHGSLSTNNPASKQQAIKTRVLVLNGEADKFVKPEQISAFKQEMEQAGIQYKFINYPDAMHAFTNPEATKMGRKFKIPIAYDAKADKASWEEMQKLFKEIFK